MPNLKENPSGREITQGDVDKFRTKLATLVPDTAQPVAGIRTTAFEFRGASAGNSAVTIYLPDPDYIFPLGNDDPRMQSRMDVDHFPGLPFRRGNRMSNFSSVAIVGDGATPEKRVYREEERLYNPQGKKISPYTLFDQPNRSLSVDQARRTLVSDLQLTYDRLHTMTLIVEFLRQRRPRVL